MTHTVYDMSKYYWSSGGHWSDISYKKTKFGGKKKKTWTDWLILILAAIWVLTYQS